MVHCLLKTLRCQNSINTKINTKKCGKVPFIIYVDLECLIEKISGCKNNTENSSTTKVRELVPSDFSISTISSIKSIENMHDVYRGKDCMKKFSKYLRQYTMEIINLKKNKKKFCYICREKFEDKHAKYKKILFI